MRHSVGRHVPSVLFLLGIGSSLLYLATDLVLSWRYPGYSYAHQAVSELSAIGAPTRTWWNVLLAPYGPLLAAFAWGVWRAAGQRRALEVSALLLLGIVATGIAWSFFPMHMRDAAKSWQDTGHLVCTGVNAAFTLGAMAFAAAALGGRFRVYSIATIVALLAGGVVTSLLAVGIDRHEPTPWMGVAERVNVYGYLLWVAVLAVTLWREQAHLERAAELRVRPRRHFAPA
jgi:hypothetical membrane protein